MCCACENVRSYVCLGGESEDLGDDYSHSCILFNNNKDCAMYFRCKYTCILMVVYKYTYMNMCIYIYIHMYMKKLYI